MVVVFATGFAVDFVATGFAVDLTATGFVVAVVFVVLLSEGVLFKAGGGVIVVVPFGEVLV